MNKHRPFFRVVAVILVVACFHTALLPGAILAQTADCDYDPENPTLENARKNFLALNYACAEKELDALLQQNNLDTQARADAHVLLAEVYYARVRNNDEKKTKVTEQFVAAFEAYRDWKGELNIKSPEFIALMREAQNIVDRQEAEKTEAAVTEEIEPVPDQTPAVEEKTEKKAWYTQWWAIGLGVGLVAGAVVLVAGGGDDDGDGGGLDTLPDFPPPPAKR